MRETRIERETAGISAGRFRLWEEPMAAMLRRNMGMLLLGVWLVLYGLTGMIALNLPSPLMAVLALLAGILILVGR
jgi:hypothetical protein